MRVTFPSLSRIYAVAIRIIAAGSEVITPVHEVAVGNVAGGREQATDIDRCIFVEQYAVGVDKPHIAVGKQRPVETCRTPADAVQRCRAVHPEDQYARRVLKAGARCIELVGRTTLTRAPKVTAALKENQFHQSKRSQV